MWWAFRISPQAAAKENIERFGCSDKVIPVLSDGLSYAHDKAETVIIAGLGGDVISYILEKDDISEIKCFLLQAMSKAEIIRAGVELGVDYSMTVSCYNPDRAGRACGVCDSCALRKAGFAAAGIADPTLYQER